MPLRIACIAMLIFLTLLAVLAIAKYPAGVHPIVDASDGRLFGGYVNGQWVEAAAIMPSLTAHDQYRVYSPTRYLGMVTGGKISLGQEEEGDPIVALGPLPAAAKTAASPLIGICGTWNALPRQFKEESTKQAAYASIVRAFLKRKGLAAAPLYISRVLSIDLDGDGHSETLIAASSAKQAAWPKEPKSYYSLVLLQTSQAGKDQTIPVAECYDNKDGDYYFYTLQSLLDVDGDGVMEVILGWEYNESGSGLSIYQINRGQAEEVLNEGWVD